MIAVRQITPHQPCNASAACGDHECVGSLDAQPQEQAKPLNCSQRALRGEKADYQWYQNKAERKAINRRGGEPLGPASHRLNSNVFVVGFARKVDAAFKNPVVIEGARVEADAAQGRAIRLRGLLFDRCLQSCARIGEFVSLSLAER
jgi:hypothetical protein